MNACDAATHIDLRCSWAWYKRHATCLDPTVASYIDYPPRAELP